MSKSQSLITGTCQESGCMVCAHLKGQTQIVQASCEHTLAKPASKLTQQPQQKRPNYAVIHASICHGRGTMVYPAALFAESGLAAPDHPAVGLSLSMADQISATAQCVQEMIGLWCACSLPVYSVT